MGIFAMFGNLREGWTSSERGVMTVAEVLTTIRRTGPVESSTGKLRLRIPETSRAALDGATETVHNIAPGQGCIVYYEHVR
jgi:hypothetical protein